eukprot:5438099-Pyramimonas_sp.AAC.1
MRACLHGLNDFIWSVAGHFDRQAIGDIRDPTRLSKVFAAFRSPMFKHRIEFISWFADWLHGIMIFASYCPRHPERWGTGEAFKCSQTGCVLGYAYEYSRGAFRRGLQEANYWKQGRFGPHQSLLGEAQGLVRSAHALAALKIRFLNDLPYVLARLRTPGVRDVCIALYTMHPEAHHDETTLHFLRPGGPLRAAVGAMGQGGSTMSAELEFEVNALRHAPLDDA